MVRNVLAMIQGDPLTSIEPQRVRWTAGIGEIGAVRLRQPHVPLLDSNLYGAVGLVMTPEQ